MFSIKHYFIIGSILVVVFIGNKLYIDNLNQKITNMEAELKLANHYIKNNTVQIQRYFESTEQLLTEVKSIKETYSNKRIKLNETLDTHKDWGDTLIPTDVSELLYNNRPTDTK